jgi:hypothetical protein
MKDKIDLDAIANKLVDDYHYLLPAIQQSIREYAKEIAHQTLVLASEKATVKMITPELSEAQKSMDSFFLRKSVKPVVDKQSILDVEKLIK